MELEEIKTAAEGAMKAWEEWKPTMESIQKKFGEVEGKLDAFDMAKLDKISDSISKAAEESQKAQGRIKALEDQQKALETAMQRPAAPAVSSEEETKLAAKQANKLFNEFARRDVREMYFHEHVAQKTAEKPQEYKALSVNSDPNGGYLVMPESGGVINTFIYESSPIRQLATVTTVGTDSYEVITDNDEAGSGWVGETESRDNTSTPGFGKIIIPVNELYAQPLATQKILDDSMIDMEAWLARKVADKFARDEATAFVSGNGVNKPKGLLSYDAGTTVASQQIQQVNSGSTSAFTYAGLVNLQSALKEAYQANAVFLTKRASIASLMTIVDGNTRPIFNPMFDKNTGLETSIMGRLLRFADDVPAIASNALSMIYGDIRAAYQIVDRSGIRVLRDAYTTKPYIKFYTTKRVGGAVVNFEAVKLQKMAA